MNKIALGILYTLDQCGEVHGVSELARRLNTRDRHIRKNALELATFGLIKMQPGRGRGNKTIFRDAGTWARLKKEKTNL